MIINTNLAAMNTNRQLSINQQATNGSLAKLSSGFRINSAADDPAGLAISEQMRGQISGLNQASSNAQDGISLVSTAEGALNTTTSILQSMRELAVQAANGTNTTTDVAALQTEMNQYASAINDIGNQTQFNTKNLLDGSQAGAVGISTGGSATVGAVAANLAQAKMTGAGTIAADQSTTTLGTDTLTIDGSKISVNWNTLLTTAQQNEIQTNLTGANAGTLTDITNDLVGAINTAIDQSGTGVAHISGFQNAGVITLESGTKGVNSEVALTSIAAATSIGAVMLSDAAGAVSADNVGTAKYNGTAVAVTDKMNMVIDGQNMSVTMATGITANETMATAAGTLQTDIIAAINKANASAGKTTGQAGFIQAVTVSVSNDGRFDVSSPSGAATFTDNAGATTASSLGLSQGQTQNNGGALTFQVGANSGQTMSLSIGDMRATALGVSNLDLSTTTSAQNAITTIDAATTTVSSQRAVLGAAQNRLTDTISNLGTSSQNITSAEANIRDVDMATEMTNFQKNNILQQAAQAMLAQANQLPQGVLQLLK